MKLPGLLIVAAALCLARPAAAASALEDVLAADAAFAARSVEAGQQAAFLEVLAEESVLFRPEAVAGREWFATHESATGRLEWTPSAAAASCSGRLAFTTGRWQYVNAAGGAPVHGHYLSLWRRKAEEGWQLVLDHGIDHAADAAPQEPLAGLLAALWPDGGSGECNDGSYDDDFLPAEEALNKSIKRRGLPTALRRAAASSAVVYRDEFPPTRLGADPPVADAGFGAGSIARSVGVIVQPGGDLAVSHGIIRAAGGSRAAPAPEALYVRVWKLDGRHWRVAVDLQTPLPADRGT
jgi:ketosteroid isomerase-like protein